MKPLVLIISNDDADCSVITVAAVSQGCRTLRAASASRALAHLEKEKPFLLFCDAVLADGGGTLRSLAAAFGTPEVPTVLIVRPDVKPGLLKALRPWVHDYLSAPVLREAAAARLKNVFRMQDLQRIADEAKSGIEGWLSRMESVVRYFDPLSFDRKKAQDDLAQRLVRKKADDRDRPEYLMITGPDGRRGLSGDIYGFSSSKVGKIGTGVRFPEAAIFLRIKSENGSSYFNYFDKGARLEDFQAAFPPELLTVTGTIYNLAGFAYGTTYVLTMNYGRAVTADDAFFLKGLALPGAFLGSVAADVHNVSESFLVMARVLALATDSQGDNGAHIRRMNEYARTLAEHMSLPGRFVKAISYSAQLHDVGKIYIHPDLLKKPLRLTTHEFDVVKKHAAFGANILGDSPLLSVAKNIALTHHECWDGSGYPAGLSGKAIPLEGAIVKVADVYDALRTMQTYKAPYSHEDACRMILAGGGDDLHEIRPEQFNPDALRAFEKASRMFDKIYQCTIDDPR